MNQPISRPAYRAIKTTPEDMLTTIYDELILVPVSIDKYASVEQ